MNEMERFYIGQAGTRTGVHDMSCRGVPSTMTTMLLLLNKSNWPSSATNFQFTDLSASWLSQQCSEVNGFGGEYISGLL